MDAALAGLSIGIPLAAASLAIGWLIIRAMLASADKPGISPALIPLALLAGVGMVLYAGNPELTELAGIASVAVGAMATFLAQKTTPAPRDDEPAPPHDTTDDELTEPVPGSDGMPPENVDVPDDIEELGK
jgi:hypothetical protein